jgi:limonene 1,2-monooxygenase
MVDSLRFGVFLAPFHPLNENPTLFFERDLELLEHLDRLGFEEAWIGEHHSGAFEMIGCPEVVIAAAAQRTRWIRLGTGVKSLPYHHPFIAADTMVMLDHMTRGRVMFGVGPGALPSDAAQLGIDPRDSRRMMDEALAVIMRLLAGERVTAETSWFRLDDAKLQLDCFTRPRMEMAVTSIRSPAGAMAAGRYGLGLLSLGGVSDEALAAYAHNWKVCEETARLNGQTVDRRNFRVTIQMHLAESRERALEEVGFGIDGWARYAQDILSVSPVPREVTDVRGFLVETRRAVIGTPDDAIAAIERAHSGCGGFGVVLLMAHDWADWAATLRSYELFARYVVPCFKDGFAARQASYDIAKARRPALSAAVDQGIAEARRRYETQGAPSPAGAVKAKP